MGRGGEEEAAGEGKSAEENAGRDSRRAEERAELQFRVLARIRAKKKGWQDCHPLPGWTSDLVKSTC